MVINEVNEIMPVKEYIPSEEDVSNEYDYYLSEILSLGLYKKGLITNKEYAQLRKINMQKYKPLMANLID